MKKIPFKTRIELLDIKGWCFGLGSMAAVITAAVVIHTTTSSIFATETASVEKATEKPVAEAVVTVKEKAVAKIAIPNTYRKDIPLDANVQELITNKCEELNIAPELIYAIIQHESNYTADAVGDNGDSFGLMQVQPKWHYARMLALDCTDLFDPMQNVTVGIDYLAEQLERYNGDIAKALVAYNAGSYDGVVTEYAESIIEGAERLVSDVQN